MDLSFFTPGIGLVVGVVLVIAALVAILLAWTLRRVVEPNEVHIVQSKGATKTYGRGSDAGNSYYEWPAWWPKIGVQTIVLPLSVFRETLTGYDAYDVGRVPFVVDIVAFFRISDPLKAAERVSSMAELQEQLKMILQGSVRTILAKEDIEQIMTERSKYGEMFTTEVHEQLKQWGVENVKNIELMDIRDGRDSKTISNIMAKKESLIEQQSRTEVAKNNKTAQIAEIAAKQETDVRQQEADLLVGQRTADKDKAVGIAKEKAKQDIAQEAAVTAEKDMAVKLVSDVRAAEIAKQVRLVKADEQRQVQITETEGAKQKTILTAEGVLKEQQLKGEGVLAVGQAEAEAKRLAEMALVSPQIELAREIGENQGYQTYLIEIRKVEKDQVVGVEQAQALKAAEIKVIANTGNVSTGVNGVMELLSSKGGTAAAGAVEAFAQSEVGQAVLKRLGVTTPAA